jgi:serine/threonine protein phosphatase PrpC
MAVSRALGDLAMKDPQRGTGFPTLNSNVFNLDCLMVIQTCPHTYLVLSCSGLIPSSQIFIAEPDIRVTQLQREHDEFIILASDGFWDAIDSQEACEAGTVSALLSCSFNLLLRSLSPLHAMLFSMI